MTSSTGRPLGVSLVAILILLVGLGMIIRGILGLVNGGEGPAGIVVAIVLLIVGVIYLLVSKGIWNGNRGSRLIVAILTLIALIGSVFTLFNPGELAVSIVQIAVSVVILALRFGG
ncbi:MAG: hypothetical protein ACKOW5_05495, partial [Actinomycetales bacterium]